MENTWDAFWAAAVPDARGHGAEAREFVRRLEREVPFGRATRILDYGCGFGLVAAALAPRVDSLTLWDKHEQVRRLARAAVAAHAHVRLLDALPTAPLPPEARFDLVLVNSVVQYMTPAELTAALSTWSNLLAADGRLVLSDLIPPGHRAWLDVLALLRFQPLAQLRRLGTELRHYLGARTHTALRPVDPDELAARAADVGFRMERLPRNLTHFGQRFAVILRPAR